MNRLALLFVMLSSLAFGQSEPGANKVLKTQTDTIKSFDGLGAPSFPKGMQPTPLTTVVRDALTPVAGLVVNNSDTNTLQRWNGSIWEDIGTAIGSVGADGSVQFAATGLLAQDTANFYWDNFAKHFGIGTALPTHALSVQSGAAVSPARFSNTNSGTGGAFVAADAPSQAALSGGAENQVGTTWIPHATEAELINQYLGNIEFYADTGLTPETPYTPTQRMIITPTGVGIGTATPATALDVVGTVSATALSLPLTSSASSGVIIQNGQSLLQTNGLDNTFLGLGSGNFTAGGDTNTGIGSNSLPSLIFGSKNTAVGSYALHDTTMGDFNIAIGPFALFANTTGSDNIAIGNATLSTGTNGVGNTVIGDVSAVQATGSFNVALGRNNLADLTTGSNNTVVGNQSGGGIDIGSNNTIIGGSVNGLAPGLLANIIIADGAGVIHAQNDGTNWNVPTGSFAVGTVSPGARVHAVDDGTLGTSIIAEQNGSGGTAAYLINNLGGRNLVLANPDGEVSLSVQPATDSYDLLLPLVVGNTGEVLQALDGTGTLGWVAPFVLSGLATSQVPYATSASAITTPTGIGADSLTWDTANGRLGIGTNTPLALLDLDKTSSGAETVGLYLSNKSQTAGTGISVNFHLDPADVTLAKISAVREAATNGPTSLRFSTYDDGIGGLNEHVRITSLGKVGIGTTAPTATLQVVGSITASDTGLVKVKANGVIHFANMDTSARDALASPEAGDTIYNTTTGALEFYDGSAWN